MEVLRCLPASAHLLPRCSRGTYCLHPPCRDFVPLLFCQVLVPRLLLFDRVSTRSVTRLSPLILVHPSLRPSRFHWLAGLYRSATPPPLVHFHSHCRRRGPLVGTTATRPPATRRGVAAVHQACGGGGGGEGGRSTRFCRRKRRRRRCSWRIVDALPAAAAAAAEAEAAEAGRERGQPDADLRGPLLEVPRRRQGGCQVN